MTDIVERLHIQARDGLMGVPDDFKIVGYGEAADAISALTAERDALRHDVESAGALRLRMNAHRETAYKLRQQLSEAVAALEPFSNSDMTGYVELGMRDEDSCVSGVCDFTFGDLIRARKVHRKATERKPVEKQNSGDNP